MLLITAEPRPGILIVIFFFNLHRWMDNHVVLRFTCFVLRNYISSVHCTFDCIYILDVPDHPTGTSNDSDKCDIIKSFWFWYYNGSLWELFGIFSSIWEKLRNMYQNLHCRKKFKIGWSELCWNFSTIYKDGSDIYRFPKVTKKCRS